MTPIPSANPEHLPRRTAVVVFLAFALAYFFSALVRAITATLSPTLTTEFSLSAQDLGLLAGWKYINHPVDGLGGRAGVQGCEDEVTSFGGCDGQLDGF